MAQLSTGGFRMKKLLATLLCLTLPFMPLVQADDKAPGMTKEAFLASLNFQQGDINLPGNIATLKLPPSFRYLGPADAEQVLAVWGNPPGSGALGMIVPADTSPLSDQGWGVIVTYEKDGHIKDDDADSIKYDELLKDMQQGTLDGNAARKEHGYPAMSLIGWAEPPSYDKTSHKLYWAKELKSEGSPQSGLNYNVRVLGREGVLNLNAVAGMDQIALMKTEMQHVTAFTDFTKGNRYTDFDSKTDKVAEYGIAALVAGGIAAKLGFFGKLFALLLVFKKLIFIGLAAFGAGVFKLFGRRKQAEKHAEKQAGAVPPVVFDGDADPAAKVDLEKKVDLTK
jgi:uncharacterized membrane-anchored protein